MQKTSTTSKRLQYFPLYTILIILFLVLFFLSNSQAQTFAGLNGGTGNAVHCMTVYNGQLIVGGDFTTADGVPANRIAAWNGASWSALGTGMDGTVRALIVFNNELYATGSFTTAGGITVNRIAKWNGTAWSALGLGLSSTGNCLAVYNNSIYVGGAFTTAGGVTVNRIARWNGTWSGLGSGVNANVLALAVYGSNLMVGGAFTNIGGIPVNRIASWDGSNWGAVGSGMPSGQVNCMFLSGANLYMGGTFLQAGGNAASRFTVYNGTSFADVGGGLNGEVIAIGSYLNEIYVAGTFTQAGTQAATNVAKWSGSAWSGIGGTNLTARALGNYEANLIIGGDFTQAGPTTVSRIAKYGAIPVAPTLVSPVNNALNVSITPLLDWQDLPNASTYGVQLSVDPNFGSFLVNVNGLDSSKYQVPSGILAANTTYFWRANARNGLGTSPFSTIWFFRSVVTGISQTSGEVPSEYRLYNNYPNPFNPATKIKFDVPASIGGGKVKLNVYNQLGEEVAVLVNQNLKAGSYEYSFDASGLSSGIYFYTLQSNDFRDTRKMILVK
jgi:hypothetical protein